MNPDNQQPPTPPPGQFNASQFDFIMNPNQPPKRSLLPSGPKQRLIIFVAIGLVIVTFLLVIIAMLFSGGSSSTDQVVVLAQKQTEIIRVATLGNAKAGSPEAKSLAALTSVSVATDQRNTLDYLARQKRKVNAKELNARLNSKTDEELTTAERNGRFDEVFTKTLVAELEDYQQSMVTVSASLGPNGKSLLEQQNKNVTLLLQANQ